MHALIGIASQGPDPAARVAEGCRRLAGGARVLATSRPWQAPARDGPDGLLVAAHVDADVRRQELRPWLWDLEGDGGTMQVELLAGRDAGRWRWGIDLDRDGAWIGPLADIAPEQKLPSGVTVRDELLLHPHAGAAPWLDPGDGRTLGRPGVLEDRRVGRTWETRSPQQAARRRAPREIL